MLRYSNSYCFKIVVSILLATFTLLLFLPDMVLVADHANSKEVLIGPGDAIQIMVWDGRQIQNEESYLSRFNREFIVDGRGYIRLSVLGEVQVSGYSADKVAEILTEKFRPYAREPVVVVIPLIRVTLYGAFRRPGTYRVPPDMTFWQLVERAGGPGNNCNFEKMRVERKGEIVVKDFLAAFEEAHSLQDVGIRSGDQIFAPEKTHLTFTNFITYTNFGISLIMMYLTFQYYQTRRR